MMDRMVMIVWAPTSVRTLQTLMQIDEAGGWSGISDKGVATNMP